MTHHPFSINHSDDDGHVLFEQEEQNVSARFYLEQGSRFYYDFQRRGETRTLNNALRCYQRALDIDPELGEAYVKLASALWEKGDIRIESVLNYCHLALTYEPDNSEAHLYMGYFLRQSGRLDEAVGQFKLAMAKSPLKLPKARMALGMSLINQASEGATRLPMGERIGLTFQGGAQFILGLGLLPFDQKNSALLGQAFVSDIKVRGLLGIAQLFRVARRVNPAWDFSCSIYEWATKEMPSESIFYHLLGDSYYEQNDPETALYFYNQAQELDPDNAVLRKKLAGLYATSEDPSHAIETLKQWVESDSSDFDSVYALAQMYSENKEYMQALYYFKRTIRLAPNHPYSHSNMGYVLFKLEDYDGAIEEYRKAISYGQDPVWTSTVAQTLGTIYYQVSQDLEAAISALTLANELDPTNLDCLVMLAELYFEQGNMQGALDIYQVIQQCDPSNPDCHNYVGYLLWQMDRNEEAIQSYQQALTYDPNNHVAYNNLGVIYLDEHFNANEAHLMFDKALQYKPDYTLAAFNLGRSQELLGRVAEAAKSYSTALELNVVNPEITNEEIQERLEELFRAP